jgi:hypothetical protein
MWRCATVISGEWTKTKPIKSTLSCPNGMILQHIKSLGETVRICLETRSRFLAFKQIK